MLWKGYRKYKKILLGWQDWRWKEIRVLIHWEKGWTSWKDMVDVWRVKRNTIRLYRLSLSCYDVLTNLPLFYLELVAISVSLSVSYRWGNVVYIHLYAIDWYLLCWSMGYLWFPFLFIWQIVFTILFWKCTIETPLDLDFFGNYLLFGASSDSKNYQYIVFGLSTIFICKWFITICFCSWLGRS